MRSYQLLLIFLFSSINICAQNYTVSKIIGVVYNNNKILKKGDIINDLSQLRAESPNAAIRLISPQKGSIPISFAGGKKVNTNTTHSELYELVIGDFISKFTAYKNMKSMKTKGGTDRFDWFDFFYNFYDDSTKASTLGDTVYRKMLIIENQKMPLKSELFKLNLGAKLLTCTYINKTDSITKELPIVNDSITFLTSAFPSTKSFDWKLKLNSTDKQNKSLTLTITDMPIQSVILTKKELKDVIGVFLTNWKSNYKDLDEAKNDFYDYLELNYGRFYRPAIETYLSAFSNFSTK
jgi:hypothetical protein